MGIKETYFVFLSWVSLNSCVVFIKSHPSLGLSFLMCKTRKDGPGWFLC